MYEMEGAVPFKQILEVWIKDIGRKIGDNGLDLGVNMVMLAP